MELSIQCYRSGEIGYTYRIPICRGKVLDITIEHNISCRVFKEYQIYIKQELSQYSKLFHSSNLIVTQITMLCFQLI